MNRPTPEARSSTGGRGMLSATINSVDARAELPRLASDPRGLA